MLEKRKGGFGMTEKINLKKRRWKRKTEGGKEVASNLITQINVAWREQLPKWTKKREREG